MECAVHESIKRIRMENLDEHPGNFSYLVNILFWLFFVLDMYFDFSNCHLDMHVIQLLNVTP